MPDGLGELYAEYRTVDGDILDTCADVALNAFLAGVEEGDARCSQVWSGWSIREGRESYGHRAQAAPLLQPVPDQTARHPLVGWDAKQPVLFRNIPMSDSVMLTEALTGVRESFGTHNLTRVYAVLAPGKEWSSVALIEVERKRVLENRQVLERCLEDLGFVATGPVVEVDTYYSRPDVDFLETVECLRVREREDGCEVTYKPASSATTHSAGDVVAKQETNVALADAAQAAHAPRPVGGAGHGPAGPCGEGTHLLSHP